MKITIFAKKRTTKSGTKFYSYLTTLKKKTGEPEVVSVKFAEDFVPTPSDCPMVIEAEREKCNLSSKTIEDEKGVKEFKTLWIKEWKPSDEPFRDTALDEYE